MNEIYRAGGDEFMIIVEGLKENEISTRLERLRELSSSADGLYFAVGVCFVEGDVDILKAMRIADERMYESKREYYLKNPNQKYR
ncbi:MAG: diguanylate cyclase [Lachnospiraceae bacterium]|nr:diguanylate cyclase [Lachnospiraceae bacterium]